MSDLLTIGRSGVLAYQGALATVGENVTNADTAGYAKRAVVLREATSVAGAYTLNRTSAAFGGVQASQVTRVWDQYRAVNAWSADADAQGAATRLRYLSGVETMIGDGASGVAARLTAIFTGAAQLASDPTDTTLRQTMLAAIQDAAGAIGQTGANLAKIAATAQAQATTLVDETNGQLAALARLNVALHTAAAGTAARAQLEDQRDNLIGALSGTLALDVTLDADGAASLKLGDYAGPVLLRATSGDAGWLQLHPAADGRLALTVSLGAASAPATPTGGALAGTIGAADAIAGRRTQLDALAAKLADQLNGWQAGGLTPAGVADPPLLAGTTAATLAPATDDPAAIAAGAAVATDNGNLLALEGLRGDDGVEAAWSAIVDGHALLVASATTESSAAAARRDSAAASLDEVTGIDLDGEAAELLRYQQAYAASAKIIQTARDTLQQILSLF